jgi:sterol desaturase/sphingolipid hydroxylase (fatty acid hydroxylase superfamily)
VRAFSSSFVLTVFSLGLCFSHDLHHELFNCNYGDIYIDWVHGTRLLESERQEFTAQQKGSKKQIVPTEDGVPNQNASTEEAHGEKQE